MFVHALQADPSNADSSPHGPGQLHVCACFTGRSIKCGFVRPTGPDFNVFADAHTVITAFRSFVPSFFRHLSAHKMVVVFLQEKYLWQKNRQAYKGFIIFVLT